MLDLFLENLATEDNKTPLMINKGSNIDFQESDWVFKIIIRNHLCL